MSSDPCQLSYLKELTQKLTLRDKELWERDRLVKLVFENCPADLVIWAVDTKLTFTLSAGSGLKHLGVEDNSSVGIDLYQYFETKDKKHLPIKMHLEALKGKTVNYDYEFKERVWHTHIVPLIDSKGKITGATGCAFDITAYIEQDKKIKKLEKILACNKSCHETKVEAIKKIV